ncbi:hypothetical protein [Rikenella microfusus]|uniref:TolB-like 6-blade propeller-like n=1 Tax=Rikenella microfusus TaxID=28139 RepID=A0A379MWQ3_9BACT|nr:hypothetical protein [Rikenella microfusus]SUE35062.1 Uncharacterised protein [Rikenella microfusus]
MRHISLLFVLISIVLSTTACQSTKEAAFGPEIRIAHTLRNPNIFAQLPEAFFRLDSVLVVISPRIGDGFGRLLSTRTYQEIGHFGVVGKGPTEVVWASAFPYTNGGPDSSFMAYDLASRSVITYTLQKQGDSLTMRGHNKRRVDQGDVPTQNNLNICLLNKDTYMGACFHQQDSIFSLIDSTLNQVGYFGTSPIPESISNAAERLQGLLMSSYGIAVYTPLDFPYIACYHLDTQKKPQKLWEDTFSEMVYRIEGARLNRVPERIKGVTEDTKVGKKHIYVLWYDDTQNAYSNRPDPMAIPGADVILIYDHDGNRIARLRTDIDLYNIELSEDERTLYALTAPNCELVTFELPEKYPVE